MKQSRILVITIIVADLILAAVCMIAYFGEDRVRPEFRFQTDEYIYTGGDGEEKLLESITAYDDRDGDISDRIVIEKITENREASTIVVYYAVSDSAGNVSKISRVFVADLREQGAQDGAPADAAPAVEGAPEMGGAGEGGSPDGADESVVPESVVPSVAGEGGVPEAVEAGEDASGGTSGAGAEGNAGQEPAAAAAEPETQEPAAEPEQAQEDRSGYPVLTLRTDEVTIAAGTSPPWTEIIETLRDDKDDYAALYYNLSVSRFDRNQAGDYPVSLYTEDSDGNRSDTVTVTVHVR